MAADKKSFLLYCDLIHTVEKLDNEHAGELFKHILRYVNDQNPTPKDFVIDIAFEPIKQVLKRDLKRYELIKERNLNNGLKGGRPKGSNTLRSITGKMIPNETKLHFLYLIYDNENGDFKIGETKNLKERRLTIKRPSPFLDIYDFIEIGRSEAIVAEKEFIELFKHARISGDWFSLNTDDLEQALLFINTKKTQWDKKYPKKADIDNDIDSDSVIDNDKDIISSSKDKKKEFDFKTAFAELGVEEQYLNDWMMVRKAKKAVNTKTAFQKIANKIKASGLTANECIKIAAERSWQGFDSSWLNNDISTVKPQQPLQQVNKINVVKQTAYDGFKFDK